MLKEYNAAKKGLITSPFLIDSVIDHIQNATTLADTGCNVLGVITSKFVRKHHLHRVPITPRDVYTYDDRPAERVEAIVKTIVDVGGIPTPVFLYEVARMEDQDIILGLPWMERNQVVLDTAEKTLTFKQSGTVVRAILPDKHIGMVSATSFKFWNQKAAKQREKDTSSIQLFAVSMADIEKALSPKQHGDPRKLLPTQYHQFLDLFNRQNAEQLPPNRGLGIDHKIELHKSADGKDLEVPYGPLYSQSREELLVLRKTLNDLLDKGFIRVSNSPAAAPILFVKKPGGGLRFCVDYRALNAITKKDRYPLPLINDTLERISGATWFTKLDVIAAFHKIRIEEGSEWMTAFRTRYGLFEWLVTPFGLANAPSTFQRYINWALREFLDDFVSAYLDDVLIFTSGSLAKHREHVARVMGRLQEAGLYIDIDKCEFEVITTKYLGFIIKAGEGLQMDPAKVEAITNWVAPTTVKGVRAFLGFANFYRRFIKNFSALTAPLVHLTKKNVKFTWGEAASKAFEQLKEKFISAPILKQFDPDDETIVETDSSGYVTGGMLQQYDKEGVLQPCAFFSQKNSPAECNYEIHDKELLAVVKCIRAWSTELRSCGSFTVLTDHQNLTYFTTNRPLTERQIRWSLDLSQYTFTIQYRPGKENLQPDVLSRREQDMPAGADDERYTHRYATLLQPSKLHGFPTVTRLRVCPLQDAPPTVTSPVDMVGEADPLTTLWATARVQDNHLTAATQAVQQHATRFPTSLQLKVSISECSIDDDGALCFRNRKWVPDCEPLRTGLVQQIHDSLASGHPGRETTYSLVARQFFWPGMSDHIRQFCHNCQGCRGNQVWRQRKQGLLKPLPVPDRIWRDISVDFITDLPESDGHKDLMVITDRLSRGVILTPLQQIDAESTAQVFLNLFYSIHGLPASIVSDRGSAFVAIFWSRICHLLGIKRLLSTAYHPETDGSTERLNAVVEFYLRTYCNWHQNNWSELLPHCQVAINNRPAASTGVSPFFLCHGYDMEMVQLSATISPRPTTSPISAGEAIAKKFVDTHAWAQASLAAAKERQEQQTNKHRDAAPSYHPGDKVWLDLRNWKTSRPSKKLDSRAALYTVQAAVGSHAYRLDTPTGVHPVFHAWLLKPAATNPLPSQQLQHHQPPSVLVPDTDGTPHEEWAVAQILDEREIGRRGHKQRQLLVQWVGYPNPTWEPFDALENTEALDRFEALKGRTGGA